ncbi:MAG: hypothetical protein HY904_15020 [Deltaproteobacteria bacterium]|nr:hypothetical protein [Deltaproteobacteria bacterium]
MTRVDRRPTVARNFLSGDRRSVESAMEAWTAARPPVTRVVLSGAGVHVAATALGLRDLATLRGRPGPFFPVVTGLPVPGPTAVTPPEALARAAGCGTAGWSDVRPGDVVWLVDGEALPRGMEKRLLELAVPLVCTLPPGALVPSSWRRRRLSGRLHVLPCPVESAGLWPAWEGTLEDLAPARILVAGRGARLFGAAVAAGDFFLERLAVTLRGDDADAVPRTRTAVLAPATDAPAAWTDAAATWRHAAVRAGATVQAAAAGAEPGVVMVPEQEARAAA